MEAALVRSRHRLRAASGDGVGRVTDEPLDPASDDERRDSSPGICARPPRRCGAERRKYYAASWRQWGCGAGRLALTSATRLSARSWGIWWPRTRARRPLRRALWTRCDRGFTSITMPGVSVAAGRRRCRMARSTQSQRAWRGFRRRAHCGRGWLLTAGGLGLRRRHTSPAQRPSRPTDPRIQVRPPGPVGPTRPY